jgi:phenylpropionate dioxygenase-like ring-hydroxylating dioxygenase large terminal subunit
MVFVPTRGDAPLRIGRHVRQFPDAPLTGTVSSDVYTDPVRFELERERVLNRNWLLAGRSSDVAATGDWLSFETHGETVVVTRQADGSLAGFHNVCSHRGPSFVTDAKGCGAKRFTCPYHGWVYDTTGALVGVPQREFFNPSDLEGRSAPKIAADEWGGFVWVNLAGPDRAVPLLDAIGADIVTDLGNFRMEDMIVTDILEWEVPVSYKAIVDGFNEVYHATQLHGSDANFTKASLNTSYHLTGNNSMMFVPRHSSLDKLEETGDHLRYTICHYVLFPNTVFNCNPEHIQVFNPIPIDVDRTRFLCWELIYPGDQNDPEYAAYYTKTMAHWEALKFIVGQDIAIYDQLKRTKRSSAYVENVLGNRECKIVKYHEIMDEQIQDR